MKPVFHTFEAYDRKVTLCCVLSDVLVLNETGTKEILENVKHIDIGIAVLNPTDTDKNIMINKVERNLGEVHAEGRARTQKGKYINYGVCFEGSLFNKHTAQSILKTVEFDFKKNPQKYVTALKDEVRSTQE